MVTVRVLVRGKNFNEFKKVNWAAYTATYGNAKSDAEIKILETKVVMPEKEQYNLAITQIRRNYRKTVIKHFIINLLKYADKLNLLKWAFRRMFILFFIRKKEMEDPMEVYRYD